MQGDWFVDPLGRFSGRYFDGEQWTNQVSDNGQLGIDPDWPPPSPEAPSVATPTMRASTPHIESGRIDRRQGGNRRQIDAQREIERRVAERRRPDIVIPKA